MSNNFFKGIFSYVLIVLILIIFVFICTMQIELANSSISSSYDGEFVWPLPGYTYISSYFGYRSSPTAGASSYHSGIDIPAPSGTTIYAVCSGKVTFASWGAGGGYTIVIENDDISVSYCHVSPIFTVYRNDIVTAR
jgi:murein DD-endopeptidase MepM/ murein hydrolase activator NlpD